MDPRAEQVLAVFQNVVMPMGQSVVAGDLVLTDRRACVLELASWAPNTNANPVRTAVAGTLLGLPAAIASATAGIKAQSPEMKGLIEAANKSRASFWGMPIEDRLKMIKLRHAVPIEEFSFGDSLTTTGVHLKGKRKEFVVHPTTPIVSDGAASADTDAQQAIAAMKSTLAKWSSRQLEPQSGTGYTCAFTPPSSLLIQSEKSALPARDWSEDDMLQDHEYTKHLLLNFRVFPHSKQCQMVKTIQASGLTKLAEFLRKDLIETLSKHLESLISKETPKGCLIYGLIFTILFAALCIFFIVSANGDYERSPATGGAMLFGFLTLFPVIFLVVYIHSKSKGIDTRGKLRELGVNVQALETELRQKKITTSTPKN